MELGNLTNGDNMSRRTLKAPNGEDLRSLVEYAVLAPSSHNTQPWYFTVSEDAIDLYADRTRALPVNDPDDRELVISCGCALMNLRVAAARAKVPVHTRILPDGESGDLLATVGISSVPAEQTAEAELFPAIIGRRTYRKRFAEKQVPEVVVAALSTAASEEGAWFEAITWEQARQDVAALVTEGDSIQWADPSWRRELAAWMHPRRKGDGLTVPGLIAPVAQAVVRTFDMGNGVGAKDRQLAEGSPLLAVLGTDGDGVAEWMSVGQALQRVLLTAYQAGLQASYLNQPIQVPALRPKIEHILTSAGLPQILLRLGYPDGEIPATPRRRLDEVIEGQ